MIVQQVYPSYTLHMGGSNGNLLYTIVSIYILIWFVTYATNSGLMA